MPVYLGDGFAGDVVYVEQSSGLFHVLAEDGEQWSTLHLPEHAVELHDADGAVSEVLGRVRHALSSVRMSQTARKEVERALDDLEPEQ
jgi:hypothetical protein